MRFDGFDRVHDHGQTGFAHDLVFLEPGSFFSARENASFKLEDVRICNVKLSYRAREFQHIVDITTASAGATPNLGDHLVERCVAEKSEVV